MFRKLVTNLPFNPSLIGQVSFYAKRLKQESSIRRLAFIMVALAMLVQMFAVIAPPEKSLAASDNHIINGLLTRDDILRAWDQPGSDIPAIYGRFGLSRQNIASLPLNPNTTIRSNSGADWWTIGRNSLSGYSTVKQQFKDTEIPIDTGSTPVYMRQLRAWDIRNAFNTYPAFTGKKADGTQFWILKDCGNFTQVGKIVDKTPPKTPGLEIRKTIVENITNLKPGDQYTYRIEYRNPVTESVAEGVVIQDELDLDNFQIVSPTNLPITGKAMSFPIGNLPFSATFHVLPFVVKVKPAVQNGVQICNAARIVSSNAQPATSGTVCKPVFIACEFNGSVPKDSPACIEPTLVCDQVEAKLEPAKKEVTLKTTANATNPALVKVSRYDYDYGDGSKVSSASSALENTSSHVYKAGKYTATATITYSVPSSKTRTTPKTTKCQAPVEIQPDQPVGETKHIKNITQNLDGAKAETTKLQAGDVLEYTLVTTNTQAFDRIDMTISDYIGDVLDYADLDTAFLKAQGGTFSQKDKRVNWEKQTIRAKSDLTRTFRIKMKSPIPSTNAPSTVSTSFDCKISNKYGNELTMNVACPVVKGIETITNTGPGTGLAMAFGLTAIVGYFFSRSRLMNKELTIIRTDYANGGDF